MYQRTRDRTRKRRQCLADKQLSVDMWPCRVTKDDGDIIYVEEARIPIAAMQELRRVSKMVIPWRNEVLQTVKVQMSGGRICCASNTSVSGDGKTVAVWLGSYVGEGTMLTEEVLSLPRDSGRAEIAWPITALRAIKWIEDRTGPVEDVDMWVDNMAVVKGCARDDISKFPSKVCQRNTDLLLQYM